MKACKSTETGNCLPAKVKTENPVFVFALQIQYIRNLISKEASVVHPLYRTLLCTSSRRPVSFLGEATKLLRRANLASCGVGGTSFTLDFVTPTDASLRLCFCRRSYERMYFLLRLLVVKFMSAARSVLCLICLLNQSLVRVTLWPVAGPMHNEGAVKIENVFTDQTWRCCPRSMPPIHRSTFSRGSNPHEYEPYSLKR